MLQQLNSNNDSISKIGWFMARQNLDDCAETMQTKKDDELIPQAATQFKILFALFLVCTLYAACATYLLIRAMTQKWRVQMVLFYAVANITLICKYRFLCRSFDCGLILACMRVGRNIYFLDVWVDYNDNTYLFLSSFPVYTNLLCGYAYTLFVMDTMYTLKTIRADKSMENIQRIQKRACVLKGLVYATMSITMIVYCIEFFLIDLESKDIVN